MYLNFSDLKKKIILFLFVFHLVLLYFFPNKYPGPCQNRPQYSLVEEPITYVCNFEKIYIQYLGFQIMQQRQVYYLCFRFRPFYYITCLFLKSMYTSMYICEEWGDSFQWLLVSARSHLSLFNVLVTGEAASVCWGLVGDAAVFLQSTTTLNPSLKWNSHD